MRRRREGGSEVTESLRMGAYIKEIRVYGPDGKLKQIGPDPRGLRRILRWLLNWFRARR